MCDVKSSTALEAFAHMTLDHADLLISKPESQEISKPVETFKPRGFLRMRRLSGDLLSNSCEQQTSAEDAVLNVFNPFALDEDTVEEVSYGI